MTVFKINSNAPIVYSEEFIIRSYHADLHKLLTLPKLCSFFQDIAGNHTVACGVGWNVMQDAGLFWVLSRLKIEVISYPQWYDKITINTWSNGLKGLTAIRHFQVLDAKGNEIIKAISSWIMVNTETRRIVKADEYMRDFPLNDRWLFNEIPEKIPALDNPEMFTPSGVSFTETDLNMHMNNVSYIDRMINSYGFSFLEKNKIESFSINFLKEAMPGDLIQVGMQNLGNNTFASSVVKETDSTEMVRSHIKWRSS